MAVQERRKRKKRRLKTRLAAAVAHPTRVRALAVLGERVASPAEIAKETGEYVGNVGYHVNTLAEASLVEEVGSRPVRGAVEHFYKGVELPILDAEQEAEMTDEDRASFAESVVALFAADVSKAIESGTYKDRTDHHLTRLVRLTDAEGYEQLKAAYMALFERVQEIFGESAERMSEPSKEEKRTKKPIRVLTFQAMMQLPKVSEYAGPALDTLAEPITTEEWDEEGS